MRLTGITFAYPRRGPVLKDFSWAVPAGRTVLLGPNGAGKSTLLSIAAGALRPNTGRCSVAGEHIDRRGRSARRYLGLVGWMPQHIRPVRGLRVREQVAYTGWLHGLRRGEADKAALEMLRLVDLGDLLNSRVHELSGGQLRRLGLAEALVHRPVQLLLDEPTAGLDPAQRERFRSVLTRLPSHVDVLISTHQVDDLEESYDQVGTLFGGTLSWVGTVGEFMAVAPTGSRRPAEDAYTAIASEAGTGAP